MNTSISRNKGLIIGGILLAAAIAAFTLIYNVFSPEASEGLKRITVEVVFDGENTATFHLETDKEYLRHALEEQNLIAGSESASGLYVTTVDGVTADETASQWWCFTKQGEELFTGVDTTPIEDGDHFEITLSTGW